VIQVVELSHEGGWLEARRDAPTRIRLIAGSSF
jgi:hypothetical protein